MGAGDFAAGVVTNDLNLVLKEGTLQAGNVVPAKSVHRDVFQAHLAGTRGQWAVDET
jgi:hypothetical protein